MTIRLMGRKMKISSWIDQNCRFAAVADPVEEQIQEGVKEFHAPKEEGEALDFVSKYLSEPPKRKYYWMTPDPKKMPSKYSPFLEDESFVMGVIERIMSGGNKDWIHNDETRAFLSKNRKALSAWAKAHPLEFLMSNMSYREIDSPDATFSPLIPLMLGNPSILKEAIRQRINLDGGSTGSIELACPTVFKMLDTFAQAARDNQIATPYEVAPGDVKPKINTYDANSLIYVYGDCLRKWSANNPLGYLDLAEAFNIYSMSVDESNAFVNSVASLPPNIDEAYRKKISNRFNYLASSGHYDAFSTAMELAQGSPFEEQIAQYAIFSNRPSDGSIERIKEFLSQKGDDAWKYFIGEFGRRLSRGERSLKLSTIEGYMERFGVPTSLARRAYDEFWKLEMGRLEFRDTYDRLPMGESVATKLLLDSEIARESFDAVSQDKDVQTKRKWPLLGGHLMNPEDSRRSFLDAWKSSPNDPAAMAYSMAIQDAFGSEATRVFSKFSWDDKSYDADQVAKVVPMASREASKRNALALYQVTQSGISNLGKMANEYEDFHTDRDEDRDYNEPSHEFQSVRVSRDGRSVLLYRGIQTQYEVPNVIESWTSNPMTAGSSTFDGYAVLMAWIPVEAILSHFMDQSWGNNFGPKEGDCEQEFIVIRSKVNQKNIEMLTKDEAIRHHLKEADPSVAPTAKPVEQPK